LVIAIIGIAVGTLFNHFYLHKDAAKELIEVALVSGIGANVIWIAGVLIYNTVRAPWLLDAESGELIDQMESRALLAEDCLREKTEKDGVSQFFGELMSSGKQLYDDILGCQGEGLASWDQRLETWVAQTQTAIADQGHHVEAVEFVHAAIRAEPVTGIMDIRNKRERRRRIVREYLIELAQIARRIR